MGLHDTGMGTRSDTTLPISRRTKAKMDSRKPEGVTWDAFFREALNLEGNSLSTEDAHRAIEAVAKLAEDAGITSASEFEEAVTERLEVDQ